MSSSSMEGRYPTIDNFYKDGKIFLTGGTGFLGKILLYTLLRRFPCIESIYVLVRERRGVSPQERMEKMLENVIFDTLQKEEPSFRSKIKVIQGNLEEDNMALSDPDYDEICSNVNIIFHCAATLKFDEDLKIAIKTNICSTQTMVQLAKNCPQLRIFTYVSTAFSNANQKTIEETIYSPATHYSELIRLSRLGESEHQEYETARQRLATENVNTYTLTKAAAEQLINEEARGIPVSIFRPSIVIVTREKPVPGYIDNMYGPTGLVSGVLAGVIRAILCEPKARADLVPVDMTVNALVCSTWDSTNRFPQNDPSRAVSVYNYVSSTDNPITWGEFAHTSFGVATRMPFSNTLWSYCYSITGNRKLYTMRNWLYHYLVGYLLDLLSPLTRNKLRLIPIYRKLDKLTVVLEPFSTNEWDFHSDNIHRVWDRMTPDDQARFPFNIKDLKWDQYLETYVRGVLVYQLGDKLDLETRKSALQRYKRIDTAHQCIIVLQYFFLILFIWKFNPM